MAADQKPKSGTPQADPRKPESVPKSYDTRRVKVFVQRYLVHLNGTKAAIEAGYSAHSASVIAYELLQKLEVRAAIDTAMEERAKRTNITQDEVLKRWWLRATADPNELIEMRRACCRYCYGKNHLYQRTPKELRDAIAQFERDKMASESKGVPFAAQFDAAGGIGYDQSKDPAKDCPECFGEGEERPFPKDTRNLSAAGRELYAGVKVTKDGLEVKMHSREEALVKVAQHLGMLKTQHTVAPGEGAGDDDDMLGFVLIPGKKKRPDGIGTA